MQKLVRSIYVQDVQPPYEFPAFDDFMSLRSNITKKVAV